LTPGNPKRFNWLKAIVLAVVKSLVVFLAGNCAANFIKGSDCLLRGLELLELGRNLGKGGVLLGINFVERVAEHGWLGS
jgi:hypothetical protein